MRFTHLLCCLLMLTLAACGGRGDVDALANKRPGATFKIGRAYTINGVQYVPQVDWSYDKIGTASWYGPGFHGRMTANGEEFNTNDMTAAHPTLPLPSIVKVTNMENGKSVVLRVNDRGPFHGGRLLDVSKKAATELGFINHGVGRVRVQVLAEESRQAALKAGATMAALQGYEQQRNVAAAQGNARALTAATADIAPVPAPRAIARTALPKPTLMAANPMPVTMPVTAAALAPAPIPNNTAPITGVVGGAVGAEALQPAYGMVPNGEYSTALLPAASTARNTGIYVQAGAFGLQENAQKVAQQLRNNSGNPALSSSVVPVSTSQGTTLFRVRLGPVATMEQANSLLQSVVYQGGQKDARIVVE